MEATLSENDLVSKDTLILHWRNMARGFAQTLTRCWSVVRKHGRVYSIGVKIPEVLDDVLVENEKLKQALGAAPELYEFVGVLSDSNVFYLRGHLPSVIEEHCTKLYKMAELKRCPFCPANYVCSTCEDCLGRGYIKVGKNGS